MTTSIEREFVFQAAVYFEGNFIINTYELQLAMEVETDSIKEQNIAMDRIKYFLSECVANSVFVSATDTKAIEKFTNADIKVCTLPDDPYDQIITIMLLLKLNTIAEGRLLVTDMGLISELSDGVKFIYNIQEARLNPFGSGWWTESTASITDTPKFNRKDKIVKLVKTFDWSTPNLEWQDCQTQSSEIIFTSGLDKHP